MSALKDNMWFFCTSEILKGMLGQNEKLIKPSVDNMEENPIQKDSKEQVFIFVFIYICSIVGQILKVFYHILF